MSARQEALAAALEPYADRSGDPHSLIDAVRDGAARASDVWEPLVAEAYEALHALPHPNAAEGEPCSACEVADRLRAALR